MCSCLDNTTHGLGVTVIGRSVCVGVMVLVVDKRCIAVASWVGEGYIGVRVGQGVGVIEGVGVR